MAQRTNVGTGSGSSSGSSSTSKPASKPAADAADAKVTGGGGDPSKDAGDPSATGAHPAVQQQPEVDEKPATRPALIQPVRYTAGSGWKVGQAAPADRFREIDPATGAYKGKATSKPKPGSYGAQVAVKGDLVTQAMLDALKEDE